MNKTAIKNYAIWARKDLIKRITRKAFEYEVSESGTLDEKLEIINGRPLSDDEKKLRRELIRDVKEKGFDHVIEEVAYTWFNRFIALRFMEVNNYLPKRVRIFTNENNEFKPQIIDEAMTIELDGLDKKEVYELLQSSDQAELYKKLLIATCNDMGNYLPGMFKKINDYRVLLFPDNLLNPGSVLDRLINDIQEDSFNVQKEGQVEIIGWFYQFYNTEPKDNVYARPKGQKIKKEEIPAVTQLFTPDWIVRYMVENSLGRLWIEGHPNEEIKSQWKYYLDEAKQDEEVEIQLQEIRNEYSTYTPETIKIIDPSMGSGHILIYAFEVLMQIYESYGYNQRDAAISIVKNNLYGIDIDERAYQLAYFAVMMKARQYNRRALTSDLKPNIVYIQSSVELNEEALKLLGNQEILARRLLIDFKDADELGSILKVNYDVDELEYLENTINKLYLEKDDKDIITILEINDLKNVLSPLIIQATLLSQKYHVTITNPPYLPVSNGSKILQDYVKHHYPDSKTDLFAVFMETCLYMLKENGYEAMINMHSWMFLSSFEKLRSKLLSKSTIISMAHLGARAFEEIGGEVVQTTSFVLSNTHITNYLSTFVRLTFGDSERRKEILFLSGNDRFIKSKKDIEKIQGTPYTSYWASDVILNSFAQSQKVGDVSEPRVGMATANNDRFVRLWYEISYCKIGLGIPSREAAIESKFKWFPFAKGGELRKWYGNNDAVVNWENDGYEIRHFKDEMTGRIRSHNYNLDYIFKSALTWTVIGTEKTSFRFCPVGFLYSNSGYGLFCDSERIKYYMLGFMNSKIAESLLQILSPSMGFESGYLRKLPLISSDLVNDSIAIVKDCITISKKDWDSFEVSWDFQQHPLIGSFSSLSDAFTQWKVECNERFTKLKADEEKLNRIFNNIYGLQNELDSHVEDKYITIRKADLSRDIRSLISYAVGCMFGRYSLDEGGLAYAGGEWDSNKYKTFIPDMDNIIPISDDKYFKDDIVGRFIDFVKVVYGEDTLDENLNFIAFALGGKGKPKEVIRNYFLNEFYKDHCNTYQVKGSGKRPIYWLFDSGNKNGFKALIYMHRYSSDLIARLRTQYVFEQQSRYRSQIEMIERDLEGDLSSSDRIKNNKQLKILREKDEELRSYEEKVHHLADQMISIDLDDGVKVNYDKFKDILAKIK